MKIDNEKQHKIEQRLLKQEKYLLHSKKVCIQLLVFIPILYLFLIFTRDKFLDDENLLFPTYLIPIFLFWYWEISLKLKHINTIRFYREKLNSS
ncbi:MAG TPA: hypothetical protein DDX98_12105 [Bacteroidales bacterium]|nr:hypothetical protein [Bacteroidales bacterium]